MRADTARDELHRVIDEVTPFGGDEDMPDAGFLTGWVLVAEWQGTDGNRWLSKLSGSASGKGLPSWQERGFCNEVVHHWPEPDDEEDA